MLFRSIEGIETFKGHSFHTSRWDYDYTGGDPKGALMEKLADKRVGIIGTGATSIQLVPQLARAAAEVYVFQRTPHYAVPARNGPPDEALWRRISADLPGYKEAMLARPSGDATTVSAPFSSTTAPRPIDTRGLRAGSSSRCGTGPSRACSPPCRS